MQKLELDVESLQAINRDHISIADGIAYVNKGLTESFRSNCWNISVAVEDLLPIQTLFLMHIWTTRSTGESLLKQIVLTSLIKQWNQLLSSGTFKNKLVKFVAGAWKQNQDLTASKGLFLTVDCDVYEFTTESCHLVEVLILNHQETDTRIILHTKHVSSTHNTDVFMIILPKMSDISANLFIWTAGQPCLVNINAIGLNAFHCVKYRNFT